MTLKLLIMSKENIIQLNTIMETVYNSYLHCKQYRCIGGSITALVMIQFASTSSSQNWCILKSSSMDVIQSRQYWWIHHGPYLSHMHPKTSPATHADNVKKTPTCTQCNYLTNWLQLCNSMHSISYNYHQYCLWVSKKWIMLLYKPTESHEQIKFWMWLQRVV